MAEMNVGILGMGSIGQRHFKNAEKMGHRVYSYDLQDKPQQREFVFNICDAIIVATPTNRHAVDLYDAVHTGNHVLVEKPIAYDDSILIEEILARAKEKKLVVATGFNLRFHECVKFVKAKLNFSELGKIQAASFTVNQFSDKAPYLKDGIIRNWLSHEIDLAHYLLGDGEVQYASATMDDLGRDSREAFISMKFPSVADKVFIQGDYYTNPEQRFFWIEGEKGMLCVNLVTREVFFKQKMDNGATSIGTVYQATDNYDKNYFDELKHFFGRIEHGFAFNDPLATGEDGVRALKTVMDARRIAGLEAIA